MSAVAQPVLPIPDAPPRSSEFISMGVEVVLFAGDPA